MARRFRIWISCVVIVSVLIRIALDTTGQRPALLIGAWQGLVKKLGRAQKADNASCAVGWEGDATLALGVQDYLGNPILSASGLDWILGDPTVLLINGEVHMWTNTLLTGILHYKASASSPLSFERLGTAVPYPGAVRAFAVHDEEQGSVVLFYEQYHLSQFYQGSSLWRCEAKFGTWSFGNHTLLLEPELDWEKIGQRRVGNPFVFYNAAERKWWLYYSASAVWLEDSNIPEPLHLGLAQADSLRGTWSRRAMDPISVSGGILGQHIVGIGSLKVLKGVNTNGSANSSVALCNRMTLDPATNVTGSTISMLQSFDGGLSWEAVIPRFISPTFVEHHWKTSYVYGFDTLEDPTDPRYVFVFYNGRNGWQDGGETVGVSRFPHNIFG